MAKQYRKKPVVIEAMQWDGTLPQATEIINWVLAEGSTIRLSENGNCDGTTVHGHYLAIETLEGTMSASVGDFIIKGVQGEFYPCKPDIFTATYEEAN